MPGLDCFSQHFPFPPFFSLLQTKRSASTSDETDDAESSGVSREDTQSPPCEEEPQGSAEEGKEGKEGKAQSTPTAAVDDAKDGSKAEDKGAPKQD